MNLLAGKIRPGVTTRELDQAAEKFIRSQGAEPAFKGYRGFPGLDLHLAELDDRARHPRAVQARARRHPVGRHRRRPRRLGRRRGADVPGRPGLAGRPQAAGHDRGVAARRRPTVPRRQPAGRRLACRSRSTSRRPGCRSCARSSATGSGAACTRTRRSPTTATPAPASRSRRGWCWPSSRWSPPGRHAVRVGDDHWAIYSQDGSLAAHFEFTIAVTADGPADADPLARGRQRAGRCRSGAQRRARRRIRSGSRPC